MNGNIKFHKPTGPAFNPGEVWYSAGGNLRVEIISVRPYHVCEKRWDYDVTYRQSDGSVNEKNAWSFQVRYYHQADKNLKTSKE